MTDEILHENVISIEDIKTLFGERMAELMLENFSLIKKIKTLTQDKINLLNHIQAVENKLAEQGIVMKKENAA